MLSKLRDMAAEILVTGRSESTGRFMLFMHGTNKLWGHDEQQDIGEMLPNHLLLGSAYNTLSHTERRLLCQDKVIKCLSRTPVCM